MPEKKKHQDAANVWQRVNAVRNEITAVDRDKTIGDGKYAYQVTTHEAIKAVLRPLMAAHGLVDYIEETDYTRQGTGLMRGQTGSQREMIQHQGKYIYHCVNVDNGEDRISFPVRGDGEDIGDKGPGKATTYALKSGQRILFQLGSEEGEEERVRQEELRQKEAEPLSDEQVSKLMELADELFGDEADNVLDLMSRKLFTVDSVTGIPAKQFKFAVQNLERKHKGEQKAAAKRAAEAEELSQSDTEIPPQAQENVPEPL